MRSASSSRVRADPPLFCPCARTPIPTGKSLDQSLEGAASTCWGHSWMRILVPQSEELTLYFELETFFFSRLVGLFWDNFYSFSLA